MREFRPEVEEFAADRENLTVEALCARFGSPEEVADGFAERDDYKALLKKAKKRTVILAVVAVLAAVACAFAVYFAVKAYKHASGHYYVYASTPYSEGETYETYEVSLIPVE